MIRVACTALLKRIVAGRSNKDGTALVGGGDDVTGDCLKATAELIGAGNSLTLKVNDADAYVIAVKAVDGANVAAQSAQTERALTDDFARLVAFHAEQLNSNPYCYFELAYTRSTAWMAWITDRPAQGEPGTAAHAKSRKVIVRGQGDTPTEACQDALNALNAARKDSK